MSSEAAPPAPVVEPRGHAGIVRGLWRAARAERLPHALLFQGPAGVGKFVAARWLVQGLYCARGVPGEQDPGPCGTCGPCKRFARGSHPDAMVVDPIAEGTEKIPIGRFVRRPEGPDEVVEEFLAKRPMEGGWRSVIVREMERSRDTIGAAQSSILKMLEEPGKQSLWVLETSRPDALLPTIKSRCIPVRFELLTREDTAGVLAEAGLPPEESSLLARWSGGSPGRALALYRQGGIAMRALWADVLSGQSAPLQASSALWDVPGDFDEATSAARDKTRARARVRARAALDLALAMVADLLRAEAGLPAGDLAHGDLLEAGRAPAPGAGEARLRAMLDALFAARQDLGRNLDPAAALDRAALALAPGRRSRAASGRREGTAR